MRERSTAASAGKKSGGGKKKSGKAKGKNWKVANDGNHFTDHSHDNGNDKGTL